MKRDKEEQEYVCLCVCVWGRFTPVSLYRLDEMRPLLIVWWMSGTTLTSRKPTVDTMFVINT
jgi:hypothetical protein